MVPQKLDLAIVIEKRYQHLKSNKDYYGYYFSIYCDIRNITKSQLALELGCNEKTFLMLSVKKIPIYVKMIGNIKSDCQMINVDYKLVLNIFKDVMLSSGKIFSSLDYNKFSNDYKYDSLDYWGDRMLSKPTNEILRNFLLEEGINPLLFYPFIVDSNFNVVEDNFYFEEAKSAGIEIFYTNNDDDFSFKKRKEKLPENFSEPELPKEDLGPYYYRMPDNPNHIVFDPYQDVNEYSTRFNKYGGYNGFDDDTIDDAFEGDPSLTWNVD